MNDTDNTTAIATDGQCILASISGYNDSTGINETTFYTCPILTTCEEDGTCTGLYGDGYCCGDYVTGVDTTYTYSTVCQPNNSFTSVYLSGGNTASFVCNSGALCVNDN